MSSTPAVGTPTSVIPSVSFNVPLSVSSAYTSPLSSGVHAVSLLTSVTTSPIRSNSAPVTSAFSEQQPSSILQITMTTTVTTTAILSSASPSVPSSTVPLTSARAPSISSSTPSVTIVATSSANRSATSAPETSAKSTAPSTTTTLNTIQLPTLTSSSPIATVISTTTTSIPILAPTSNTPPTTTSLHLPSSLSPLSSLGRTDAPLTTVLESTTVFFISTNSQGQVMTSIPAVVTEVITTTGSGGIATTITQAIVNPTLAPNSRTTGNSSFFNNTGAVVGVFVVVGLASASIMMWILFAIRHRQRMRRIEQDTAVEAAVAAAGLNRAPLDDDDGDDSPVSPNSHHQFTSEMGQRSTLLGLGGSSSLPTSTRLSATLDDNIKDSVSSHPRCPIEHRTNNYPDGYVPARTISPSPRAERCTDDLGSSRDRKSSYGHTPTYSAGSFEPLLANYLQNMPDQDTSAFTTQPPRNRPSQHMGSGLVLSGTPENGSRASSKRQNSSDSSVLRDEEDYTHYVLMVRNVPDDQSQHSVTSV